MKKINDAVSNIHNPNDKLIETLAKLWVDIIYKEHEKRKHRNFKSMSEKENTQCG